MTPPIFAYPPTDDPVIVGLVEVLNEAVQAKYCVKLRNDEAGSGFFAQSKDLPSVKREVRQFLKAHPCWKSATIYTAHRGLEIDRVPVLTLLPARENSKLPAAESNKSHRRTGHSTRILARQAAGIGCQSSTFLAKKSA